MFGNAVEGLLDEVVGAAADVAIEERENVRCGVTVETEARLEAARAAVVAALADKATEQETDMSTIQEIADAATAALPEHIAHYVQTIRPHMVLDDVVIEFKPSVRALDGRDVIRLAAILIDEFKSTRRRPPLSLFPHPPVDMLVVGHDGLLQRSVTAQSAMFGRGTAEAKEAEARGMEGDNA